MTYKANDIPRVLALLYESTVIDAPDNGSAERVDGGRAWDRMPHGTAHRLMLATVVIEDKSMTSAAAVCGMYPAKAKVFLEESVAMFLARLNNKYLR